MTNPVKKRFYWILLQQDLSGTWCIRKIYGGFENNRCREVWIPYPSELYAAKAFTETEYSKRQRGYIYDDIDNVDYFALKPQIINKLRVS
ncbi:MAG: hypothetical protein K0R49_1592 [Burkholderiales bacterium]|nr:hypothetical protein [Burkholderiales bacterium]